MLNLIETKFSSEQTNYQTYYSVVEVINKFKFSEFGASEEAVEKEREKTSAKKFEEHKNQIYNSTLLQADKQQFLNNDENINFYNDDKNELKKFDKPPALNQVASFIEKKSGVINVAPRNPDLKETLYKIKPFLEKNLNIRKEIDNSNPDEIFQVFPFFEYCIKEDRRQTGFLIDEHFVSITGKLFTELDIGEVWQLASLGRLQEDIHKIDYMKVCREVEGFFQRLYIRNN